MRTASQIYENTIQEVFEKYEIRDSLNQYRIKCRDEGNFNEMIAMNEPIQFIDLIIERLHLQARLIDSLRSVYGEETEIIDKIIKLLKIK